MIHRRTLMAGLPIAGMGMSGASRAQVAIRTSYGPTTTDITTGHAGHTSLPSALGYWREEGLDVNVFGIGGSTMGMQLLSAGHVDFVGLSGDDIILARARGIPITAVYLHARQPISTIVVPTSSGITSLAGLKGKTIGMPVIVPEPYAAAAFREVGMDMEKDVRCVAVGTGAPVLLALRRGDIAGYIAWDTAVAGLEIRGIQFTEFRPSFYQDLFGLYVATRTEVVEKTPELVVKMCRGIAKGVTFGMANPEAAIRIHWREYPQTKPSSGDEKRNMEDAKHIFMSRFVRYGLEPGARYGESRPAHWQRVTEMMAASGTLPAGFDVNSAYTNRFVEEVNAFDHAAITAAAERYTGP